MAGARPHPAGNMRQRPERTAISVPPATNRSQFGSRTGSLPPGACAALRSLRAGPQAGFTAYTSTRASSLVIFPSAINVARPARTGGENV